MDLRQRLQDVRSLSQQHNIHKIMHTLSLNPAPTLPPFAIIEFSHQHIDIPQLTLLCGQAVLIFFLIFEIVDSFLSVQLMTTAYLQRTGTQ